MNLLGGVVNVVVSTVNAVTSALSSIIGSLINVLGTLKAAATGIAGFLVSAVGGVVYNVFPVLGVVTAFIGGAIELLGVNTPSLPVPNPIVRVTTDSGSVHKVSYVPMGGIPVAIDVDDGELLGQLRPDINVAVGLLGPVNNIGTQPIEPSITIAREPFAAKSGAVAPPLKIQARIELKDALNDFSEFATIDYGYDTPPGGRVPPLVKARITGPLATGFVDPLKATIDAPGYSGPLKFLINASTKTINASFGVKFDPLPVQVNLVEDPRSDGLDVHYDHSGPIPDVKLDADAVIVQKSSNKRLEVGASIERLPRVIDLSNTNTPTRTFVDYSSQRQLREADLEATYKDFAGDGKLTTEANIKVGALPNRMEGTITTAPNAQGGADMKSADFRVLDGDEIGSVDFLVRNYAGDPGPVPELNLGPRQFVTLGVRKLLDGMQRYRAAGRITGVRSIHFERTGPGDLGYDVRTDLGDGIKPLRAVLDVDGRAPATPDGQRFKLDATISPLPKTIHAVYLPGGGAGQPTQVTYDASQVLDATAVAEIDRGTFTGCGRPLVTCATARVDKVPSHLALSLPGQGGTDYSVSHNGVPGQLPDIRAIVDNTPETDRRRVWAQLEALRVPTELRARVDTSDEQVMRKAEFHACAWDYAASACTDAQQALGRVRFKVRNSDKRPLTLPNRPDQATTFVSLIRRFDDYEIEGRVDELRNVFFRQRDDNHDGKPDGTLGVKVDAGVGGAFDAHVDQLQPDTSRPDPKPPALTIVDAHVAKLPTMFHACFRQPDDPAPPAIPGGDPLLGPCDRRDVLGRSGSDLTTTPLAIYYKATASTPVDAHLTTRSVDPDDPDSGANPIEHTRRIDVDVADVPNELRADVIAPKDHKTDAGQARALEARYESNAPIARVDLTMDNHRTDGTPAPNGSYIEANLLGIPTRVSAKVDTARKVLKRADFHACDYDFGADACKDAQQALGDVRFLARPQRRRGALPAVPLHADTFVSLIKRLANSEITAHVSNIRNVSFRQRDVGGDGEADGTLGVLVDAGVLGPFDAHIDQVALDDAYKTAVPQPTAAQAIDAHVDSLPTMFKACFRKSADAKPVDPSDLPDDALLEPCDRDALLGYASGALPATPLSIQYNAFTPTKITARVRTEAQNKDDDDRRRVSDMDVVVDKVPTQLRADLIAGRDVVPASGSDPEQPARALQFNYTASDSIGNLTLGLENRRSDETNSDADLFAKANVSGIPAALSGEVDSARKVVRRAEFHACPFNFTTRACTSPSQQINDLKFTVRPHRQRGSLPPQKTTDGAYVSLVKRFTNSEITGHVPAIHNVAFHQRDERGGGPGGNQPDGKADGTLGLALEVGNGAKFDAHIDQVAVDERDELKTLSKTYNATTVLDAHLDALPKSFTACLRSPHEGGQPPVSPDPLLTDCDSSPLTTSAPEPEATPLALVYHSFTPTKVKAETRSIALDTQDRPDPDAPISDANEPIEHTSKLDVTVDKVPGMVRADMMPSLDKKPTHPARRLQLAYDGDLKIDEVKFALEDRRTTSLCLDPRNGRKAMCLSGRVTDIPKHLDANFDPDESRGAFGFNTNDPAAGDPLLSIHDLVYKGTSTDSNGHPMSLKADILGIPPHITGRMAQYAPDATKPRKKEPAVVRFNGCPTGECPGIQSIDFTATNSLIDTVLPGVPAAPEANVTQDFSLVQRGDDFRAKGKIGNLKEIKYSRLPESTPDAPATPATIKETKHLRAAFGATANEKIRAYLDTDSGTGTLLMDGIIREAPKAVNLCLREVIKEDDTAAYLSDGDFCDKARKNAFALSAGLDEAATSVKPDVQLYKLRSANAAGTKILTGTLSVDDLGQRITALIDKGKQSGLLVEGRDLDNNLANVAGRVTFDLRNFDSAPINAFPFKPMGDNVDPPDEVRNDDPGTPPNDGRNYVVVGQDIDSLQLKGSIPDIKRVGIAPGACDATDTVHFPAADNPGWPSGTAPTYTCLRAAIGAGRPLGLALRMRKATPSGNELLAVEEGHISSVPTGGDGLETTITSSPSTVKDAPACSDVAEPPATTNTLPCKPELLALKSEPTGGAPMLEARAFIGPEALINELGSTPIIDPIGERAKYDQHPRDFTQDGVRVRVGSKKDPTDTTKSLTAIRIGLRIPIPRWLDMDQPTFYSCDRKAVTDPCIEKTGEGDHSRTAATDIFMKIVTANDTRFGGGACAGASCYLGRLAVNAHNFDKNNDIFITGAPPADTGNGTSSSDPESPPGSGAHDFGLELPRHVDVRLQMRENHAGSDPRYGTTYIQTDARLNAPVSLMARLPRKPVNRNRDGQAVPQITATVRNLAGLGDGVTNFDNPTQRARIVLQDKAEDPGFFDCRGAGLGVSIPALAHACLITPHPELRWVNVDLSADPDGPGTGNGPARDVEAIIDTREHNEIEMKGFGDLAKSSARPFGLRAGLRLEPFALGARVGGGIGLIGGYLELTLDGDLIVKASNEPSNRVRASNNAGAIELTTAGGKTRADVNLKEGIRAKIVGEVLFGLGSVTLLNVSTPRIGPVPVSFRRCSTGGAFGTVNFFETADNAKAGMTLGAQFPTSILTSGPVAALLDLMPPAFCLFMSTSSSDLINASNPAPGYSEPGRPVIGTAPVTPVSPPPPPAPTDVIPPDVNVSGVRTECGVLNAKKVHVHSGGTLAVGGSGCDGRLQIIAEDVQVDSGGQILASNAISAAGAGTPGAAGAGAGHSGAGGNAGNGASGGGTYGIPAEGIDADIGSPALGSLGGDGGGTLAIVARNAIQVDGTIAANGGNGLGGGPACANVGGGGGSGGAIHLTANRVTVGGTVSADGGTGGTGGHGGGGGGGGRIRIDRIALQTPGSGSIHANGRTGGGAGSGCTAGATGGNGNPAVFATVLDRGAGVEALNVNPNGFVQGSAQLAITGVQQGGGDMVILVCYRTKPVGTADGFTHPDLDPGSSSVSDRLTNDTCSPQTFSAPTEADGVTYKRTINVTLGDQYYGFYVFAAKPSGGAFDFSCTDPTPIFGSPCDYQDLLPTQASVRLASDNTAPTIPSATPIKEISGSKTDCGDGTASCQTSHTGIADIRPDDGFSGVDTTACRVNGGGGDPFGVTPCTGSAAAIDLGLADGEKRVDVRVTDRAGNVKVFDDVLFWRVDSTPPAKPTILVIPQPGEDLVAQNGWTHAKPDVSVLSGDGSFANSGGFGADPITFFVDGGGKKCGGPKATPPAILASCSATELAPEIPAQGTHRLDAFATDRLGNQSVRADDPTTEADDKILHIDSIPPDTKLFLGPESPDGAAGWYKTNPIIAFATSDTPGGAGVDLTGTTAPSGVWFNIDGGGSAKFNPSGADQKMPGGTHTICWHGVDLANNPEAEDCMYDVKVDNDDPSPQATIVPASPDGSNSFYRTAAHFTISGGDGSGSGIDQGLNPDSGIFFSIDGAPFERYDGSAANLIDDGDRELCWYAVDVAGNLGGDGTHDAASCRRLHVDTVRPPVVTPYLDPPRPDGINGWYATRPLVDFAQRDADGGSGGEASGSTAPAGVRFSVDGSPYTAWNPTDDAANRLGDGEHDLCWRGIDIAGNGADADAGCQHVKVDSTAPVALAPIVPATPDGDNSYYVTQPKISPSGTDASPGSGLARVEAQVDGGPWTEAAEVAISEGEHDVRVRAVDNAGNHSPLIERVVRYDGSDPTAFPATYPPVANLVGWFRQPPAESIAVEDGRDGSGEDSATYQLDGSGPISYLRPFLIEEGLRHLVVRPRDHAGRIGPAKVSDPKVDLTPPRPVPVGQPDSILLPFQNTTIKFDVPDNLSPRVRVRIHIYDKLGALIRELTVPGDADGYRPAGPGSIVWNGTGPDGKMVFPTVAHYRVQATDEAGNSAQSTEGKPFLILLATGGL